MLKKLYDDKKYLEMAEIAQNAGQMLYIYTYIPEQPEENEESILQNSETTYATLEIAPINYYICYRDNYTDGTVNENYKEQTAAEERARLDALSLTAADVERAIYKAKGMDFDDLIEAVKDVPGMDIKALKIELRANNFFRNHPYINQIGALLGYSSDDLDYLFLHKEFPIKG